MAIATSAFAKSLLNSLRPAAASSPASPLAVACQRRFSNAFASDKTSTKVGRGPALTGGMPSGGLSGGTTNPKFNTSPVLPDQSAHHSALTNISTQLSGGPSGLTQAWRERREMLRGRSDRENAADVYAAATKLLLEPKLWTYGSMVGYQRKLLDLVGAHSWRRRLSNDDPNLLHLEKELRVLEAMTPIELMSNHKSVFTKESLKLIAEKADCTVKFVENVITNHDVLRGDRRWYQILKQFGRPLPTSFEDRGLWGQYDRPFSEKEQELRNEMMEKHREKMMKGKPPRQHNVFFRQPSIGGNQWSTRPPKSYPVRWPTRPERKSRLAGVGVPGGGGDRGRPWGKLGNHFGGGAVVPKF
mmetsp:Transcript_79677/g.165525  ORF Transcript_79677/g.165525 Transcript_79677/m.165525 type:complete len:358 (-) Transcript_79677:218-1291(-)|eukprot:CAMPEP_0206427200 /NCGR_PEP_ID=MMETSP0324_2-20121206/4885_1 /ASSEMBLY_ACC=CAM_ASM_000836 /TAXON_ID=2866 /ORGANISM="Crypthecodinium cohnii, Strain Seligo" /LENGTH=357 /DNA_ID=CAMNT_0053892407 /DNA_START=153 /DNA_END=1226 /DNA_ORIENTATION=+